MQFDFATGSKGYFTQKSLAQYMLVGYPGQKPDKLLKGSGILINKFGADDQRLYWRGFLKSYERTYKHDKKSMGKEMKTRGLRDDIESPLPAPLWQFLLYKFRVATQMSGDYFDVGGFKNFMKIGYPDAQDARLSKGAKKTVGKFGVDGKLYWEGFVKLYEASYKLDKRTLKSEFERRGFTLHLNDMKAQHRRKSSRGRPDELNNKNAKHLPP
eukprot:UN23841